MRKRKPPKRAVVVGSDVVVRPLDPSVSFKRFIESLADGPPIVFTGAFVPPLAPVTSRQFEWPTCDVCDRIVEHCAASFDPVTEKNFISVRCHGEVETIELKLKTLEELDSLEVGRAFARRRLK